MVWKSVSEQNATDKMPLDKMPPTVEFVFLFFKMSAKFVISAYHKICFAYIYDAHYRFTAA